MITPPASIQTFVAQQQTTSVDHLTQSVDSRPFPYTEYWRRAVAGMLLSGRVKSKHDGLPNMTDVNRIGKEANFNPYFFEQVATFLIAAQIVESSRRPQQYVPGAYAEAFWQRDAARLSIATRSAFLSRIQHLTGSQVYRPTLTITSELDAFIMLFTAAFSGLALREDQFGVVLQGFSQLPCADLEQFARQLGQPPKWEEFRSDWRDWLDRKGQEILTAALITCEWIYAAEAQEQNWCYMNDIAHVMLGLQPPPPLPPLVTDFQALPNLCIFAAADMPPDILVPLFRYCKIKRIDRIIEFQLDKKHFGQTPSPTPGEHELRLALKGLEPLPDTIDRFLDTKPLSVGEIRIRACSALLKPENEEILAAIREHRQLRGYLEAGAPAGYLLIKAQSDPYNFIQRCEQLGFTVKSL